MVKEAKFFRKQAEKAARMALGTSDADVSQRFASLAQAYRSQAEALKKTKIEKSKAQMDEAPGGRVDKKPKDKKKK